MSLNNKHIFEQVDLEKVTMNCQNRTERRLGDLKGRFADTKAYEGMLKEANPLVYAAEYIEAANGAGDMHYGLGMIMPGKVGQEYFLTKGHLHAWREAAEIYIGLKGKGVMLLEDEKTGESRMVDLLPYGIVYVPGYTAHRTCNTGEEPLVYLGLCPAKAGYDYETIGKNNFVNVVVEKDGAPVMMKRKEFLNLL